MFSSVGISGGTVHYFSFLIEAQLSYAGVFVSLPSTAHCSCLMNRENKPRTHHDEGAEQHGLDPLGALMPALHKR